MSKKEIEISNRDLTDSYLKHFVYVPEDTCPICKNKISPVLLHSVVYDKDTTPYVSLFQYCTGCHSTFISNYIAYAPEGPTARVAPTKYLGSEPNHFAKQEFDPKIIELSPQFDKIYNQALAAEFSGLDEIAGLGYRKALEFLIKDFAIHEHPDDEETIKAKPLAQCIKTYITNENVTTLAERSTWIGNDEAHYIRKQEDRDVSDMKDFIQAIVYFIGMILITEDAASMSPKK